MADRDKNEILRAGNPYMNAKLKEILAMDDPDDVAREFSRGIVAGFFEQAATGYKKMKAELDAAAERPAKLREIAVLASILRGSAATIGFDAIERCTLRIADARTLKDSDYQRSGDNKHVQDDISAKKAQENIGFDMGKLRTYIINAMRGSEDIWAYDFKTELMDGDALDP